MRYGLFLPENGTIGFVAPSFGCNIEPYRTCFEAAQDKFRAMGYRMNPGPNCYEGSGIGISNTPEKCGKELMDYYLSADNDLLISCGGGELMCEVLDHVDFAAIKEAAPKWYMGFSDNTNMTFLLATLCDTAAVYGPCAPAFGMKPWHESLEDAFGILTGKKAQTALHAGETGSQNALAQEAEPGNRRSITLHGYDKWERESLKDEEHPLEPYHVTEEKKLKLWNEAGNACGSVSMKGRLIGGCLDCLSVLVGTKYDKVTEFNERYEEDGIIWFLEACDLNVLSIRRTMWQLDHAGWFQHIKGFMIGRPLQFDMPLMGLDQYEAVLGIIGKYHVPVIMDADLGHLPPMLPLITGSMAKITAEGNELTVNMELV